MDVRRSLAAVAAVFFVGVFPAGWFDLYDYLPNFDKMLHFLGGLTVAWLIWAITHRPLARVGRWISAGFVVGLTTVIGVIWEFAEYYSGYLWGQWAGRAGRLIYLYFHGGGLADTLADLAFDITGALVFVILVISRGSRHQD